MEIEDSGHEVQVVLEPHATVFVGPAAFEGRVVEKPTERPQALLFAPAAPETLAKLARGMSDSPALNLWLDAVRPAVAALDADADTVAHPAVLQNVRDLREAGCRVLLGQDGAMVSSMEAANVLLGGLGGPLSGLRVLVTAGGTREPIDRVRVVSNRSSGKMGRAIAREAVRLGAEVTIVAANVGEAEPGVTWIPIETVEELRAEVLKRAGEADALIMAAAVSDFTPAAPAREKIRRTEGLISLELEATVDILKAVRERYPDLYVVAFAATHGDPVADAHNKLASKGANLVVGNDISQVGIGFGTDENEVYVVGPRRERFVPRAPKSEVARVVLESLVADIGVERQE